MRIVFFHISILLLLLVSPAFPQSILRTENGIVDLLDDDAPEESAIYRQQLSELRLQGESEGGGVNRFLSLGLSGPVVVFDDQVQNRPDIIRKYISEGRWRKALAEVNDGLALNPDNPDLLKVAAYVNTVLRDFYMANYYYGRYYRINPKDINVLSNWAGILIRTFNFSEAIELIDKALELNPNHLPSRFYRMIIALTDEGMPVDRQAWEAAPLSEKGNIVRWISADADNYKNVLGPKGFQDLCDIAIGEGSFENIEEIAKVFNEYNEALAANADEDGLERGLELINQLGELGVGGAAIPLQRAIIAYRKGELDESLAIMGDLSKRYPEDDFLLAQYGYALLQAGRYSEAETVSRRSLDIRENMDAKIGLASSYLMTGKSEEAWDLIWEVTQADPQTVFRWLQDDKPYIRRILADKTRYTQLCNRLGIPPESR